MHNTALRRRTRNSGSSTELPSILGGWVKQQSILPNLAAIILLSPAMSLNYLYIISSACFSVV